MHNGHWQTSRLGAVDWNAKIIWKMRTELDFQWDLLEDDVSPMFETVYTEMVSLLHNLSTAARGKSSSSQRPESCRCDW